MRREVNLFLATSALAMTVPMTPAFASGVPALSCSQTYNSIATGATACAGLFDGNIFGGSKDKVALQTSGLSSLGSALTVLQGGAPSANQVTFGDLSKITSLQGGNTISFGKSLYGQTIIGAHFGNIAGPAQNVSVMWLFDFGSAGANGVRLNNTQGFSNAVLYSSNFAGPVPEPGTWALLTLAFGVVGATMRRRTRTMAVQYT